MVNRAVLLAHRLLLDGGTDIQPADVAVLSRTLNELSRLGVAEALVVDGELADEFAQKLALADTGSIKVSVTANEGWRQNSGSALLAARDFLLSSPGPVLVLPAERPLDAAGLAGLVRCQLGSSSAAVAVSPSMPGNSHMARVRLSSGAVTQVTAIGLDLDQHDAVCTGHAVVHPSIVHELERLPNPSLADGLSDWVRLGRVSAVQGHVDWPWGLVTHDGVDDSVAAILDSKSHPRYTLLNPGPVNTTSRVKSAMVHHDVCHRDSNFSELMTSLSDKLRRVFRGSAHHTVCVLTGSGTAAMECALSSSVPRDGKILIIDNGAFGERAHEVARMHDMDVIHLRYAWGDLVNPRDVERVLSENPDIAVVAMPHHETSVGLLNPVTEVGALCREYDSLFVVDAVSSLGAEDIDVVRDNIDICFGSANKCLHAISGAGFLCVSPRAWNKIEHVRPRSYYLDLKRYRRYTEERAQTPFTPAVSAYFALDAACDEFLTDGHKARWQMYRSRNERLRSGLTALGMAPFTHTGRESHSVVTACVPSGIHFADMYRGLKQRGFIVYACKDVLADRFFQVANMGELCDADIDAFLRTAAEVIEQLRTTAMPDAAAATQPALRVVASA